MAEKELKSKGMGAILGTFTGKCCDSNVFNNNDMHLSRELFEKLLASDEYKRAMQNRHYIGFLSHPEDMDCQDDQNACIVMTDLRILDNGEIEGDFDLVDTPVGRIVKSFIDAGVKYGISIRGLGDVDGNGEVDPDGFIFRGFDLVRFPAYDDCIPEFKAIAASTDAKKKAAYKKVYAAINTNLKDITSCETLEAIQDQFEEGSDQFKLLQNRIDELGQLQPLGEQSDDMAIAEEKLEAMTELYLDANEKAKNLEQELVEAQLENSELVVECKTAKSKFTHLRKVIADQVNTAVESHEEVKGQLEKLNKRYKVVRASEVSAKTELRTTKKELETLKASYQKAITANTRLKEKLSSLTSDRKDDREAIKASENLNLKYQRKIEANSEAISQKDSAIEDLKSKLHETVVAKKKLESKASNLDEKCEELQSRVEAAEEMVLSYQQAYANIYANALGVYLTELPITANTSVEELSQMIKAGTSTANIAAAPAMYEDDLYDDDDDFDMTDDTNYSAEMVTL